MKTNKLVLSLALLISLPAVAAEQQTPKAIKFGKAKKTASKKPLKIAIPEPAMTPPALDSNEQEVEQNHVVEVITWNFEKLEKEEETEKRKVEHKEQAAQQGALPPVSPFENNRMAFQKAKFERVETTEELTIKTTARTIALEEFEKALANNTSANILFAEQEKALTEKTNAKRAERETLKIARGVLATQLVEAEKNRTDYARDVAKVQALNTEIGGYDRDITTLGNQARAGLDALGRNNEPVTPVKEKPASPAPAPAKTSWLPFSLWS